MVSADLLLSLFFGLIRSSKMCITQHLVDKNGIEW